MNYLSTRRDFIKGVIGSALVVLTSPAATTPPNSNPAKKYNLPWTDKLFWGNILNITSVSAADVGDFWDKRVAKAQEILISKGGGVIYFPPGTYRFRDNIYLNNGIILRGAEPEEGLNASDSRYTLNSRLEFPRYTPSFTGDGAPVDTAFKGILSASPKDASNCGVVHLDINRGYINLGEADNHSCGSNRIVFGCIIRNAAGASPDIPNKKENQPGWLRYTHKFRAAIGINVYENALVAQNRIPKSGDDNFVIREYPLKDRKGTINFYEVEFDYDNRPGIYVNHYCIGGQGGSGNDGTPQTHPHGFRKGIYICDNYIYSTGRTAIGFCGDGVICAANVIRFAKDIIRPTVTGIHCSYGSSTNDNRAVEMRGWRWTLKDNDYEVYRNLCSDKKYYINDGEGLMHEDHCNSTVLDSYIINNRGNSYLSIFHCGEINGLHIEGNDISVSHSIQDIYVATPRHKQQGEFPIKNVSIVKNITRSNGIRVYGFPSEKVVVKDNRHIGEKQGVILNEANAELENNVNYIVKTSK
ncbi:MAG: hypothetical protein ACP5K7_01865 [Verrucomicrobiia bacterium]|jgi:hypothetical protein